MKLIQYFCVQNHLVRLSGSYEGRVFDERDITFSIGEIPDDEVISGIQKALTHFGKGEISRWEYNFNKFLTSLWWIEHYEH